jgi:hypothetical protein
MYSRVAGSSDDQLESLSCYNVVSPTAALVLRRPRQPWQPPQPVKYLMRYRVTTATNGEPHPACRPLQLICSALPRVELNHSLDEITMNTYTEALVRDTPPAHPEQPHMSTRKSVTKLAGAAPQAQPESPETVCHACCSAPRSSENVESRPILATDGLSATGHCGAVT